jgi:hypothetical protein
MDCDPLDPQSVAEILSQPPFVTISGVHNVRDLGSIHTADPQNVTKSKFLYRSAEISGITEEGAPQLILLTDTLNVFFLLGKAQMKALGITCVFDLRSDTEIEKYNTPLPAIDGIELVRTPVFQKDDYSPEMMAKYVRASPTQHSCPSLLTIYLNIQALPSVRQRED